MTDFFRYLRILDGAKIRKEGENTKEIDIMDLRLLFLLVILNDAFGHLHRHLCMRQRMI